MMLISCWDYATGFLFTIYYRFLIVHFRREVYMMTPEQQKHQEDHFIAKGDMKMLLPRNDVLKMKLTTF